MYALLEVASHLIHTLNMLRCFTPYFDALMMHYKIQWDPTRMVLSMAAETAKQLDLLNPAVRWDSKCLPPIVQISEAVGQIVCYPSTTLMLDRQVSKTTSHGLFQLVVLGFKRKQTLGVIRIQTATIVVQTGKVVSVDSRSDWVHLPQPGSDDALHINVCVRLPPNQDRIVLHVLKESTFDAVLLREWSVQQQQPQGVWYDPRPTPMPGSYRPFPKHKPSADDVPTHLFELVAAKTEPLKQLLATPNCVGVRLDTRALRHMLRYMSPAVAVFPERLCPQEWTMHADGRVCVPPERSTLLQRTLNKCLRCPEWSPDWMCEPLPGSGAWIALFLFRNTKLWDILLSCCPLPESKRNQSVRAGMQCLFYYRHLGSGVQASCTTGRRCAGDQTSFSEKIINPSPNTIIPTPIH